MTGVLEPSETQIQIQKLETEIETLKLLGQTSVPREISKLRTIILDANDDCAEVMGWIVTKHVYASANKNYKATGFNKSFPLVKSVMSVVMRGMSLPKLTGICADLELINKELEQDLYQLGQFRIWLAHPMDGRWKWFNDEERVQFALELVVKIVRELAKIEVEFGIQEI